MRIRSVAVGVTAGLAVLAAACGGGGGSLTVTEDEVDAFLAAARPGAEELPGEGWTIASEDEFNDEGEPPADTPECRAINDAIDEVTDANEPSRLGRTEREYTREEGPDVTVSFGVFDNDGAVTDAIAVYGETMGSNGYIACFIDVLKDLGEGAEAEGQRVAPSTEAPREGVSGASEFVVTLNGETVTVRVETYGWQVGNVGVVVDITGQAASVTQDVVANLIATVSAKLESAANGE